MENIPKEKLSWQEQEKRDLWLNLENVGPDKPIGYLLLNTIENILEKDPHEVISYLQNKGLEVKVFFGPEWPGANEGALYAYDKAALQKMLDENRQILLDANWPINADQFVSHLKVQEKTDTPLFKLIAKTFADKFSEELKADEE